MTLPTTPTPTCVLYARVSTEEQAELSIPAQVQAMRDYARRQNWTVTDVFLEAGVSGRSIERRMALQALLKRCRENPKVDIVLVHKIDRLARSVFDHATIRFLLQQRSIRLASVVENVDDSVSGQLLENIMASIAQFYSANLGEEVKKGMRMKVERGGWPHRPPRGYTLVRGENGRARVDVHPTDGPLLQRAFELYATGRHSLKETAAILARDGLTTQAGQPIAAQYFRNLLTNPFYVGRLRWKSLEVPGDHPPLVPPDLFARVQEVLQNRFRQPGAKVRSGDFPLRGLAMCVHCRGHMTAGWQRSGQSARRFGYYRCARRGYNKALCPAAKGCQVVKAHRAVERICARLRLSAELVDAIGSAAKQQALQLTEEVRLRAASLRASRSSILEREHHLTEGFAAGHITPDVFKATAAKLRSELAAIERELSQLRQQPRELTSRIDEMLKRARNVGELHRELSGFRRAELLRTVFARIVLDESGVVGFVLQPPFDAIRRYADRHDAGIETATTAQMADELLSAAKPIAPDVAGSRPGVASRKGSNSMH